MRGVMYIRLLSLCGKWSLNRFIILLCMFVFVCWHVNVSTTNRSKFHTFEQVSHRNIRINLSQLHHSYPLFLAPIRRQAHCIYSRHSRLGEAASFKSCESRAYAYMLMPCARVLTHALHFYFTCTTPSNKLKTEHMRKTHLS
jgi:hypothetical protein